MALPILRGEQELWLRKDTIHSKSKSTKSDVSKTTTYSFANSAEEALWQALKAKRMELARDQGVPPYIIFHDATLMEILKAKPTKLNQLKLIGGVGQAKLDHYGAHFLSVINAEPSENA